MHRSSWLVSGLLFVLTAGCSSGPAAPGDPSGSGAAGGGGTGEGLAGGGGSGGDGGSDGSSSGGSGTGGSNDALDSLVTHNMAKAHMPGLAACIVKGGKVAWCNGYGLADVEAQRPVTEDTVFLIASISKTVTASVLMQLWEKGAFELDGDVDAAVPFSVQHPTSDSPITYRGLLTHTAGVRDNWDALNKFYDYDGEPDISLEASVSGYFKPGGAYYDAQQNFLPQPPGAVYEYTNMGVALAGYLAEALSGTDFAVLSREAVLEPLAMKRTSWHITDFKPEELAMPYAWNAGAYEPYGQYTFADYPDGGLRTSAPDLARFLAAITAGGTLDGERILEESTVAEMMKIQLPAVAPTQGLIFYHMDIGGEDWVGHNGGESGVATDMYYRVSDGLGFVVLMNGDWGDAAPVAAIEDALIAFGETLP
jgi:CubicO group peptidase (beta-lactamase class C family)